MENPKIRSQTEASTCREKMIEINRRYMKEMCNLLSDNNLSPLAFVDLMLVNCRVLVKAKVFGDAGVSEKELKELTI